MQRADVWGFAAAICKAPEVVLKGIVFLVFFYKEAVRTFTSSLLFIYLLFVFLLIFFVFVCA